MGTQIQPGATHPDHTTHTKETRFKISLRAKFKYSGIQEKLTKQNVAQPTSKANDRYQTKDPGHEYNMNV